MNEMQDLLQLRLDTPPVDRSVGSVWVKENFLMYKSVVNQQSFQIGIKYVF